MFWDLKKGVPEALEEDIITFNAVHLCDISDWEL